MALEITTVPAQSSKDADLDAAQTPEPLRPDALCRVHGLEHILFETTDDVPEAVAPVGHERATGAMRLALGTARDGFNLFVMGPPGSGKRSMLMQIVAERAPLAPTPDDWVYVNNFDEPTRPVALRLPPGDGSKLRADLAQLVEELRTAIPAVFESDEYRARESQLEAEFAERHEKAFAALGEEAAAQQVGIVRTPAGFSIAPLKNAEVMSPEEFAGLPQAEQTRIQAIIAELQGKLEQIVRRMIEWRREWRTRLKALNREMTLFAVGNLVGDLRQRYSALPCVPEVNGALAPGRRPGAVAALARARIRAANRS